LYNILYFIGLEIYLSMSKYYTLCNSFTVEAIRYGGYFRASSEYITLEQCHGSWGFIHVVRGFVSLRTDQNELNHILQPGDTLFLTPSVTYKFRDFVDTYESEHQNGFVFVLAFEVNSPLMEHFNERLCNAHQDERHYLSTISTELERTFDFSNESEVLMHKDAGFASEQIVKNYIELFLISCYRRENLDVLSTRESETKVSPRKEALSMQVLSYIHQHVAEKITLNDIADALNLSVSLIERCFNEYTGNSVIAYISQYRIDEAKRLIEEGGHSFTEIADRLGFDNVHYFSNRFRKYSGMTPTQYAKSLTGNQFMHTKYTITYMEEEDWGKVPYLILNDLHWGNTPNIHTEYQIAWNKDRLMLHARIRENRIMARYDKPNRPIYFDSYTEFFFRPIESQSSYINVGINPNGAIYCGVGEYKHDRIRILMDLEDESSYYNVKTLRSDTGWEAYWSIPINIVQLFFKDYSFEEGMVLSSNCCKCATDGLSTHYLSWTLLPAQSRSFHQPEYFGTMVLGPKSTSMN